MARYAGENKEGEVATRLARRECRKMEMWSCRSHRTIRDASAHPPEAGKPIRPISVPGPTAL